MFLPKTKAKSAEIVLHSKRYDSRYIGNLVMNKNTFVSDTLYRFNTNCNILIWFIGDSGTHYPHDVSRSLTKYNVQYANLRQLYPGISLSSAVNGVLEGIKINTTEICLHYLSIEIENEAIKELGKLFPNVKRIRYLGLKMIYNMRQLILLLESICEITVINVERILPLSYLLPISLINLQSLSISFFKINAMASRSSPLFKKRYLNLLRLCKTSKCIKNVQITGVTRIDSVLVKVFATLMNDETREVSCRLKGDLPGQYSYQKDGDAIVVLTKMCKQVRYSGLNIPSRFTKRVYANILSSILRGNLVCPELHNVTTLDSNHTEKKYVEYLLS